MDIAAVAPRLLIPDGDIPPAALVVQPLSGQPFVLAVEGEGWDALEEATDQQIATAQHFLRAVVGLTVAVAAPPTVPAQRIAGACDLGVETLGEADAWVRGFSTHPWACLAALVLSRRTGGSDWDGLVAESATYSTLQAGSEFRAWLAARPSPRSGRLPPDVGRRIRVTQSGDSAEIVLTRGTRHNAIDSAMRDELCQALDAVAYLKSVIIRGEGPSFSAGGDLDEFGSGPEPPMAHIIRLGRSLAYRFSQLSDKLVVGLHGACFGAGIELPAFAELVVAADDLRLCLPEAGFGLIPGAGGTVSIRNRAGARRLVELILSGHPIDAETALAWGLVDEVVPRAELESRLYELTGFAQ